MSLASGPPGTSRPRRLKNNGPTHYQYVEPLNEKETIVHKLTKTRFVIVLLVAMELSSSWHLGVKPDVVFLLAAWMILRKED